MAVDLKRIRKGILRRKPRILIYGFDGIGKSGFAAGAPNPFFLDANRGSHNYDVGRVDVTGWDDVQAWLASIEAGEVQCDTVVLDALTDLEAMSHVKLFGDSGTVTDHKGGYGKGDDAVIVEWRKTMNQLERVWNRDKAIIFTAHARVKKFEDPTAPIGGGYERFEVGARPFLAAMIRQWVDYVFFAREKTVVVTDKSKPSKATTTGARYIYTRRCPAFDAKARGTLLFPSEILLSYPAFEEAMEQDLKREDRITTLRKEIDEMLEKLADPVLTKKVNDYMAKYPAMIVEAHNNVSAKMQERMAVEVQNETPKENAA